MNQSFLNTLTKAFEVYLKTSSQSNEKLKVLHKFIAQELSKKHGKKNEIRSLGIKKKKKIKGRYFDKTVDITILKNGLDIAGIGVKFVMSNYAQNAINYFENMLGETANIRCARSGYFHIIIIPNNAPYFDSNGKILKIEKLSNLSKYIMLSKDNAGAVYHTPNKTLLCVVDYPEGKKGMTKDKYKNFCENFLLNNKLKFSIDFNPDDFESSVILNDFETFLNKIYHFIESI